MNVWKYLSSAEKVCNNQFTEEFIQYFKTLRQAAELLHSNKAQDNQPVLPGAQEAIQNMRMGNDYPNDFLDNYTNEPWSIDAVNFLFESNPEIHKFDQNNVQILKTELKFVVKLLYNINMRVLFTMQEIYDNIASHRNTAADKINILLTTINEYVKDKVDNQNVVAINLLPKFEYLVEPLHTVLKLCQQLDITKNNNNDTPPPPPPPAGNNNTPAQVSHADNTYNAAQLLFHLGIIAQHIIITSANNDDYSKDMKNVCFQVMSDYYVHTDSKVKNTIQYDNNQYVTRFNIFYGQGDAIQADIKKHGITTMVLIMNQLKVFYNMLLTYHHFGGIYL